MSSTTGMQQDPTQTIAGEITNKTAVELSLKLLEERQRDTSSSSTEPTSTDARLLSLFSRLGSLGT